ncbi:hypothetical protein RUND412_005501 [Rhizina undulata]
MAAVQPPATNGSYLQQADPQSFPANSAAASPAPAPAQTHSTPQPSSPLDVPKDEVGWLFVEQYYTTLNKSPERLHLFYNKKSSFVWGTEGENLPVAHGRTEIQERISAQGLKNCKVRVSNVDSHASINDSIVIQVLGEILGEIGNNGLMNRRFTQTFLLAVQPNGYYVHNDIFRYLKDDDDIEDVEEFEYVEETVAEAVAEAIAEAAEVVAEELVEAIEELSVKETTKAEVGIEGDKVKVEEETYSVEPAVPVAEEQGLPPPSVNGTAQSLNGAPSVAETEPEPESQPKAEELAVPEFVNESAAEVAPEPEAKVESVAAPPVTTATSPKEPERPAAPVPVPAAVPAKPKSWASLVSGNKAAPTTTPIVPVAQPNKPQTTAIPATPATPISAATPTTPTTPGGGSPWQNVDGSKRHARPTSVSAAPGQTQAYVKGVIESVSNQALNDALSKFGSLKNFEVNRAKSCAFVEFETPAQFAAAQSSNPHRIGDATVIVEERRRHATNGSGYGAGRGGRGGFLRDGGRGLDSRGGGRGGAGNRGGYARGGPRTNPAGGN